VDDFPASPHYTSRDGIWLGTSAEVGRVARSNPEEEVNMKRAIGTFGMLAVLFATLSLATIAETKTMTWTGWISDSSCGVKGANAAHKACAKTCMKDKGASWVFVNNGDKKVLAIHNQDAVDGDKDLGQEVTVTGHVMDDGSLHVDSIAAKT
jgi:hypothetical protein